MSRLTLLITLVLVTCTAFGQAQNVFQKPDWKQNSKHQLLLAAGYQAPNVSDNTVTGTSGIGISYLNRLDQVVNSKSDDDWKQDHVPQEWEKYWISELDVELGFQTLAIPNNSYSSSASIGIAYQRRFSRLAYFSLGISYMSFPYDDKQLTGSSSIMPLTIGLRINFTSTGVQPYVGVEACRYFITDAVLSEGLTISQSSSYTGILLKGGIRTPINKKLDFDMNFKYNWAKFPYSFERLHYGANAGLAFAL